MTLWTCNVPLAFRKLKFEKYKSNQHALRALEWEPESLVLLPALPSSLGHDLIFRFLNWDPG